MQECNRDEFWTIPIDCTVSWRKKMRIRAMDDKT